MVCWVLLLIYHCFGQSFASPLSSSPLSLDSIVYANTSSLPLGSNSDAGACADQDTRSFYQIVSSCMATLLACTWVAVHPNISAPSDSDWRIFVRKFKIAFHLILAPENVILWAAKQRLDAEFLAEKYSDQGWTVTHGFFLLMGGYTLWSPAPPTSIRTKNPPPSTLIRVLTQKDLDELFNSRSPQVNFPILSAEEIKDRSKADWLAKVVVLAQTMWFIVNCVGRLANKLPLSELEVMTLAYAALSGLVSAMWWNKPTDVRLPVKVHLLDESLIEKWASVPNLQSSASRTPPKRSIFRRVLHVFRASLLKPLQTLARDYGILLAGVREIPRNAQRVPTFFSPELRRPHILRWTLLFDTVGVIFGGIHLMAWASFFPTEAEKWLWRVCSLLVAGGCTLACLLIVCGGVMRNSTNEDNLFAGVEGILIVANSIIYVSARFILLTLPWIQLRGGTGVNTLVWKELDWSQFFVHFR